MIIPYTREKGMHIIDIIEVSVDNFLEFQISWKSDDGEGKNLLVYLKSF